MFPLWTEGGSCFLRAAATFKQSLSLWSSGCFCMDQYQILFSLPSDLFYLLYSPHSTSSEGNLGERCWLFGVLQRRCWCLHPHCQSGSAQHRERWAAQQQLLLITPGQAEHVMEESYHWAGSFWGSLSMLPAATSQRILSWFWFTFKRNARWTNMFNMFLIKLNKSIWLINFDR